MTLHTVADSSHGNPVGRYVAVAGRVHSPPRSRSPQTDKVGGRNLATVPCGGLSVGLTPVLPHFHRGKATLDVENRARCWHCLLLRSGLMFSVSVNYRGDGRSPLPTLPDYSALPNVPSMNFLLNPSMIPCFVVAVNPSLTPRARSPSTPVQGMLRHT